MKKDWGMVLSLLLLAACGSCRRQQLPFQRLEIPKARAMDYLAQDGAGGLYFQKPGLTMRFGHKGRGVHLASPLAGLCCLQMNFWSSGHGRMQLRAGGPGRGSAVFLKKEFSLSPGFNEITVDLRLRRGDRLVVEADQSGVFSRPLLYLLLPAAERRNVFLISADNLGADHMELYGYRRSTAPAITAFRKEAVLFRWAFADSPWTLPSHMSLFTGLHESEHHVTFRVQNEAAAAAGRSEPMIQAFPLRRETEFLVERLSRFFIACGFSGGINVAAAFGFYRGFDLYQEAPNDHLDRDSAARLFRRAERHLLQCRFPAAFYFLHTYQVHLPYQPPPDLLKRFGRRGAPRDFDFEKDIGGIRGLFRRGDEPRRTDAVALYDAEIMEFDRRFGEFVAFLKRHDLYDRSMIILLADHGEEFFEHGSWAHGSDLFNSQIRVPLLVKFPEGRYAGRGFNHEVSLVDVMPSVLEYFAIPAAPAISGRSLLGELRGGAPGQAPLFCANRACRNWSRIPAQAALIQGGYKLIRQFPQKAVGPDFFVVPPPVFPVLQLFHLARDPGEMRDLAAEVPQLAARMNARLQRFLDVRPTPGPERSAALPDDTLNILRSLGYIR